MQKKAVSRRAAELAEKIKGFGVYGVITLVLINFLI